MVSAYTAAILAFNSFVGDAAEILVVGGTCGNVFSGMLFACVKARVCGISVIVCELLFGSLAL